MDLSTGNFWGSFAEMVERERAHNAEAATNPASALLGEQFAASRRAAEMAESTRQFLRLGDFAPDVHDPELRSALLRSEPPQPTPRWPGGHRSSSNCIERTIAAPFTDGNPRVEEVGDHPILLEVSPSSDGSHEDPNQPGVLAMRTSVRQSIPNAGELSLAAALGKLHISEDLDIIHPPAEEEENTSFDGTTEYTTVRANLGQRVDLPGSEAVRFAIDRVRATAELAIGRSGIPYHLHLHGQTAHFPMYVGGSCYFTLVTSTGFSVTANQSYLSIHYLADGTCYAPTPPQRSITLSVDADPGAASWIYLMVEASVWVSRWNLLPSDVRPPLEDRGGFVAVDLRSRETPTPVYPPLGPRGPVRVRAIDVDFCVKQVLDLE